PHRIAPQLLGRRLLFSVRPGGSGIPMRLLKSVIDRVAAAVLLTLSVPLFIAVGLWIWFDSHGPVLFRQVRTGKDGVRFTMYKFRTMSMGAEERLDELREFNEGSGPLFKMASDPRVTRSGRFLRAFSLDELPQLMNVLKGEMSLIGPRPGLPTETETYD